MNVMDYFQMMAGGPARDAGNANTYGIQQPQQQAAPVMPAAPEMPEMPAQDPWRQWIGDPSGFAGAGMQAPPLPNPMGEIGNLMNLAMQQVPQQQQQAQPMGGNLMNYLRMLSGGQDG